MRGRLAMLRIINERCRIQGESTNQPKSMPSKERSSLTLHLFRTFLSPPSQTIRAHTYST